jgi:serine/threonine protein kinase/tetratricopeptide (TPR) repeat protein
MRTAKDPAEIFEAARELREGPERRSYLAAACGDDAGLRRRVEGLLKASERAEAFFEETATAVTHAVAELHADRGTAGMAEALSSYLPGEEPLGTRIGRYKLVRKIGEGGCGVVYEAEQEEPVRRRVALKIIKIGMETKSVIARFEAERQALALMDHPNIAHVFDAGATRRGPPYFVMELVRGVKITEYCDAHRLDTRARLDLFVQICHAIQHAHQKGVIHGDIKPSNIMVTLHDGTPVPKVIDFGISKATESSLMERMLVTSAGQLIGTPAYMSPEQAERGSTDIDTRSDIYSLGVLLYELLTGRTPFDPAELSADGVDGFRRLLREKEPLRPSVRLKLLAPAQLAAVADARETDASKLGVLYRGDLDWVVMKALEKDRRRRYETANGLAVDIQRHLANEPVIARPPSRVYRFQKLVRRNRAVFAGIGAVGITLVLGLATSTWLFFREREARQRAVAAERQEAKLRREAEHRQKITQAVLLVNQDKFPEADALLAGLSVAEPSFDGAAVFRAVGEWHAVEDRWSKAAAYFQALLQIDQLDGWDVSTLDLLRQGPALLNDGNLAQYERFREETLRRYGTNPVPTGDRVLKICLLAPAREPLLKALQPFADGATASLRAAEAGGDSFAAAWRAVSLALWEYRSGNGEEAIAWARRCLQYHDTVAPRTATAHLVLGLAARQLGHADLAATHLQEARDLIEAHYHAPPTRGTPVQGFWFDWEFARVLLREAGTL